MMFDLEKFKQLRIEIPPAVAEPEPTQKAPPTRCEAAGCKKKLGLTAFACRCKGYYCAVHRADDAHGCTFDYKEAHRAVLSTSMVKVVGSKVDVI
jgi:predicted nucleic acid binding AN1-type Zn finger protein